MEVGDHIQPPASLQPGGGPVTHWKGSGGQTKAIDFSKYELSAQFF